MAYQPNEGRIPDACLILDDQGEVTGHRPVHVRCYGGYDTRKMGAAPWPSHTGRAQTTNWKISRRPHPFEIQEWVLA